MRHIIDLKVLQKYCFLGNIFSGIYSECGCIETLLELLKFCENLLVLSIPSIMLQQEQQRSHLVRVHSARHCDRQYHQQRLFFCYVSEPEVNREYQNDSMISFYCSARIIIMMTVSSRTKDVMCSQIFPVLCITDSSINCCRFKIKIGLLFLAMFISTLLDWKKNGQ